MRQQANNNLHTRDCCTEEDVMSSSVYAVIPVLKLSTNTYNHLNSCHNPETSELVVVCKSLSVGASPKIYECLLFIHRQDNQRSQSAMCSRHWSVPAGKQTS